MKCFNCNAEMMNHLVITKGDQIAYDICEKCGSLWLDRGELSKIAFQVDGDIEYCSTKDAEGAPAARRQCPRCDDTALHKALFIGYSDIVLDHCKNCGGFWLDGSELDRINEMLGRIMPVRGSGFSDFVKNVHLPYWYKRIKRQSSKTDFEVDVPPLRHAELQAEAEYACPSCHSSLNSYVAYGTQIEGCPKCKGIWLDREELRKLKDEATKGTWRTLRWMDDEVEAIGQINAMPSRRLCLKCEGVKLLTTSFGDSPVLIDWCRNCGGIWLDREEFEAIVQNLRSKLDALTSGEMRAKVYEEIKEIWNGPEDKIAEILDAKAAVAALINMTIFEHPRLYQLIEDIQSLGRSLGA